MTAAGKRTDAATVSSSDIQVVSDNSFSEPSPRIQRIRDQMKTLPVSICLERPKLIRKCKKTPEYRKEKHPALKRARILAYIFSNRKPVIYEDELICGNMTSMRIAANYYPEGGSSQILEDIFVLGKRKPVPVSMGLRQTAGLFYTIIRHYTEAIGFKAFFHPGKVMWLWKHMFQAKRFILTEAAGVSHQIPDYETVVKKGLVHMDKKAKAALTRGFLPDGTPLDSNQIVFFQGIRLVIGGIRTMAQNLSAEARNLAMKNHIPDERRQELLTLAEALDHVPYFPARTFQEGLQSCWLIHICMNLEDFEQGLSFGRLDRILWDLFQADFSSGRITPSYAAELIASFQLKACETVPLFSRRLDAYFSGNTVGQGITLGGVDENGNDTTNMLSGLFLDAFYQIKTREPNLHVRIHENTPLWFMEKSVKMLRDGCCSPAFFGDTAIVNALCHAGMDLDHARDYAVIGCVELGSQGRTYHSSDAALFNLPMCLEMALNQGRAFDGRKREGAHTQSVCSMKSFSDLLAAYKAQVEKTVSDAVHMIGHLERTYAIHRSTPVNSMLTQGTLDTGMDVTQGGGFYDFTSLQIVGLADVGDSLYAINRLVFEERKMELHEFTEILKKNYKGSEALAAMLHRKYPKYGNGISEVDVFTQMAVDVFTQAVGRHKNTRGGQYLTGVYSMTCHTAFGRFTGAMASGRRAGNMLANGLSPATGADVNGPTAVLRSASSLDNTSFGNCYALNIRFDEAFAGGAAGERLMSGLLMAYLVDQEGMQVQVNILDKETLISAQKNPDAYRGLLVRVAGYCAYFNDLEPLAQDELISRTAHQREK